MVRVLALLLFVWFGAAAANNDDGFVWIDANTKIKLKPIGKTAGSSAAGGATQAPAPKKEEKKEEAKK